MDTIIKYNDFQKIADSVKPDSKKRVGLRRCSIPEGVRYHIYSNVIGQILLDPQVTIPASELWLFENKDALALVDRGMLESMSGKAIKRGSFAKYVKDAP